MIQTTIILLNQINVIIRNNFRNNWFIVLEVLATFKNILLTKQKLFWSSFAVGAHSISENSRDSIQQPDCFHHWTHRMHKPQFLVHWLHVLHVALKKENLIRMLPIKRIQIRNEMSSFYLFNKDHKVRPTYHKDNVDWIKPFEKDKLSVQQK